MKKIFLIIPLLFGLLALFLFLSDQFERVDKAEEIALYECTSRFPLRFSYTDSITGKVVRKKADLDEDNNNRANFQGLKINQIPKNLFKKTFCIQQMNLSNNRLSTIPTAIQDLSEIRLLSLSNNWIKTIPFNAFSQNEHLNMLYLDGNYLQTLDLSTFVSIPFVSLNTNEIDTILPMNSHNRGFINHLDLNYNELDVVDLEIFKSIDSVSLALNNIKEIRPVSDDNSNRMINLNLKDNQLYRFPRAVQSLTQLRTLNLDGNHIGADPTFNELPFDQFKTIRHLILSGNRFTRFPKELGKLPQLGILNLNGNQIKGTVLFSGFNQLYELKITDQLIEHFVIDPASLLSLYELNFRENRISTFEVKEENTVLQRLDLQNNRLSFLPSSITKLKELEYLNLSKNKMKTLRNLTGLANLQELDLSRNSFAQIPLLYSNEPKNSFRVDLSANRIKVLDFERVNKNITELILSHSTISSIENLIKLPNLKKLNLRGNSKLKDFPLEIFDYLVNLKELDLRNTAIDFKKMRKINIKAIETGVTLKQNRY